LLAEEIRPARWHRDRCYKTAIQFEGASAVRVQHLRDITERKRAELRQQHRTVLQMRGWTRWRAFWRPLFVTSNVKPALYCSILLPGPTDSICGFIAACCPTYVEALDGVSIATVAGSNCATVFRRAVIVRTSTQIPLLGSYREVTRRVGLGSC
jgi:hypothetical protein